MTKQTKQKFKKGYYQPKNPEKYQQPIDRTMNKKVLPEFRSSYELKFFKYADLNPLITKWGTEPFPIKYYDPITNRERRYFVDCFIEFKSGSRFLVEIKPHKETLAPTKGKRLEVFQAQMNTFITNTAKWEAAKKFCEAKGMKFIIITEKILGL